MPKQYDKYKNSGIAWIGEMPQHWNIHKLNNILTSVGSGTTPKGNDAYYGGKIPWLNTGDLTDSYIYNIGKTITELALKEYSTLKIYTPNSVVIAMYGATIGKLGILTREATTNQACCVISCKDKLISKYLFYVLYASREYILTLSYGAGQPNISQETIKTFRICLPNLLEQQQIADYLDKKCAEIDRIVETQKNIIEKLKVYKQAVTTEAVTKGLDKSAPLKDSGIEWIGKIPEHWEIRRLKTTLNLRNEKIEYNGEQYIGLENVTSNSGQYNIFDENIIDGISNKFYNGDVLFGKLRPYLAKATIVDFDGLCSSEFLVMQDYQGSNNFLLKILLCYWFIDIVNSSTYGAKMPRASWDFIGNMLIPFPKFNEQQKIADYLDKKCSEIDTAISKKEQLIEKLTEYKKSLIYECVTGKRKVA